MPCTSISASTALPSISAWMSFALWGPTALVKVYSVALPLLPPTVKLETSMTPMPASLTWPTAASFLAAALGLLGDRVAGEHRRDGLVAGAALEGEHVVDRPRALRLGLGFLPSLTLVLVRDAWTTRRYRNRAVTSDA